MPSIVLLLAQGGGGDEDGEGGGAGGSSDSGSILGLLQPILGTSSGVSYLCLLLVM